MKKLFFFFSLALIFILPLINAGCCFDSTSGVCGYNAEQTACVDNGGQYLASCETSECKKGCCILGNSVKFETSRTCDLDSSTNGFGPTGNFQNIDEVQCSALAQTGKEGACLYGEFAPFDCKYQLYETCTSGNFYEGVTCDDVQLNTLCKITESKVCHNDDVYLLDTCGNPAKLDEDCDYASGTMCGKNEEGENACISLDCSEELKNGDSACTFDGDTDRPIYQELLLGRSTGITSSLDLGPEWWSGTSCFDQCVLRGYQEAAIGGDPLASVQAHCYCFMGDYYSQMIATGMISPPTGEAIKNVGVTGKAVDSSDCTAQVVADANGPLDSVCSIWTCNLDSSITSTDCYSSGTEPGTGTLDQCKYLCNQYGVQESIENARSSLPSSSTTPISGSRTEVLGAGSGGKRTNEVWYAGGQFMIEHCVDGKATLEKCDDYRQQYCEPGNHAVCKKNNGATECKQVKSAADCIDNPDCYMFQSYHYIPLSNKTWRNTAGTVFSYTAEFEGNNDDGRNEVDNNRTMSDGSRNPLLNGVGNSGNGIASWTASMCMSKVPPGVSKEDTSVCSGGSVEGQIGFAHPETGKSHFLNYANIRANPGTSDDWSPASEILYGPWFCYKNCLFVNWNWSNAFKIEGKEVYDAITDATCGGDCCSKTAYDSTSLAFYIGTRDCSQRIDARMNYLWNKDAEGWVNSCENSSGDIIDVTKIPLNMELLDAHCRALGDCSGELVNWAGAAGTPYPGNINYAESDGVQIRGRPNNVAGAPQNGELLHFNFKYECKPFRPPKGDEDCGLCNTWHPYIKDAEILLPCTKYRCEALGTECEFTSVDTAEGGFCMSSSDNVGPDIWLISSNPSIEEEIPYYLPIELVIGTSEFAQCKFNLNRASGSYDLMEYPFGTGWGIEHTTTLHLPGQITANSSANSSVNGSSDSDLTSSTSYPLIKEGKNELFVRCIDPRENGATAAPFIITFNVKKMPDGVPPVLSNFTPVSGSRIKYNTTTKEISFEINEPAECKWDFKEALFDSMNNSFECDTAPSNQGLINGYGCSGTLKNITAGTFTRAKFDIVCDGPAENPCREVQTNETITTDGTTFYIRCKDQPGLVEEGLYKRNENMVSTIYSLSPTLVPLNITSLTPFGEITKSAANYSMTITAQTSDGANYGTAACQWRLSQNSSFRNAGFTSFLNTNSAFHSQIVTAILPGLNYIQAKCEDYAGNTAEKNVSVDLLVDESAPFLTRLYEKSGKLTMFINEFATCFYSFNRNSKCLFNLANASLMTARGIEQTLPWDHDRTFYIKCKDPYGNVNSECSALVRTY
jgi:hypothetical protein